MVQFNATLQGGTGTLAVFFTDGESRTLQSTHPAYVEALTYLVSTPADQHDEDHVRDLVNPALRIGKLLAAVDPKYTFDLFTLSYDGLPMSGPLADLIKDRLNSQSGDWERFARFAARLEQNPSYSAKQALFKFIQENGLAILADGRFVGHKSVTKDFLSAHRGPNNFVNGVLYGKPGEHYQVPHYVGTTVSKRRGDVDDTAMACSTGLHVGSLTYATKFSTVLLTVAICPEDVVGGNYGEKFRTAKYEILGVNEERGAFVGENYEIVDRTDEVTPFELALADQAQVKSRAHAWESPEQQAEYNSLPSVGRTLYDSLRTLLNKTHDAAYAQALAEYGTHQEWIARRDEERAAAAAEAAAQAEQEAAEQAAQVEVEQAESPVEKDVEGATEDESDVVPSDASAEKTLAENAAIVPALLRDLQDKTIGHKPLARKWSNLTTEASVRRYRKTHGIEVAKGSLAQRIKGALS